MYHSPSVYIQDKSTYARRLFARTYRQGRLKQMVAQFTGQPRKLLWLSDVEQTHHVVDHNEVGTRDIEVERIHGSLGKGDEFDRDFHPRRRGMVDRWVQVAQAIVDTNIILPPIEVVQANDNYYVIDGHHRVSAARALGRLYVRANVTEWVLAPRHGEEESPVVTA